MKDTRAVHGDRGMCDYSLCSICHRYSHTVPFGRYVPGLADSSLPSLRFSRLTCFPAYMLFPQGPNIAHPTVIPDDDSSRASYPSERAILPPAPAPPTRSPPLATPATHDTPPCPVPVLRIRSQVRIHRGRDGFQSGRRRIAIRIRRSHCSRELIHEAAGCLADG
jgi:hypothetical protein